MSAEWQSIKRFKNCNLISSRWQKHDLWTTGSLRSKMGTNFSEKINELILIMTIGSAPGVRGPLLKKSSQLPESVWCQIRTCNTESQSLTWAFLYSLSGTMPAKIKLNKRKHSLVKFKRLLLNSWRRRGPSWLWWTLMPT